MLGGGLFIIIIYWHLRLEQIAYVLWSLHCLIHKFVMLFFFFILFFFIWMQGSIAVNLLLRYVLICIFFQWAILVTILGYRLLLLLHDCELQVAMNFVCLCVCEFLHCWWTNYSLNLRCVVAIMNTSSLCWWPYCLLL